MGLEIGSATYQVGRSTSERVRETGKRRDSASLVENAAKESESAAASKTDRKSSIDSFTRSSAPAEETGTVASESKDKNSGESVVSNSGTYRVDTDTIEQMKADSEQRMANLVKLMLGQQIDKENMWEKLRTGQFTVDAETQKQAQEDISEDGYWGVEKTSDRIVDFAVALTGGDPDKLDAMIAAFDQGYAEAEKTWGGELPELAQKTREAVYEKFQKLKDQYAESGTSSTSSAAAQTLLETSVQQAAEDV